MTARNSTAIAAAVCLIAAAARADDPSAAHRPPLEFKDLTPPAAPAEHGEKPAADHAAPAPEGGGLFGTAEYLLLRPRRGAFDFAVTDADRDLVPTGALQSLNYDLRSGVRAGLGYRFADSLWDAKAEYTYLGSGAARTVTAPAGGTVYATLTRAGLNDEAAAAAASAGLSYNVFDAVAGRRVALSDGTAARVFGGVRWATVRQTFGAEYTGGDANVGRVQADSGFDGFGPVLGGEVVREVRGGFHVYGRAGAALLSGKVSNPYLETNNAGRTVYASLDNAVRRVVPVATLGVGAGWQRDNLSIRAGYEVTNWFGLIESPRFTGELSEGKMTSRTGDLSLEGFFLQIGLAF